MAYGGGIEAAIRAFQLSKGLLADGIAGRRTLAALNIPEIPIEPVRPLSIAEVTVEKVSHMFRDTSSVILKSIYLRYWMDC